MIVLGLTGSIGMGKTRATDVLRRLGVPVHDADAEVHRLLRDDRATIGAVETAFPGVARGGAIDRRELGRRVFGDEAALRRLESILHPRVRMQSKLFLGRTRAQRKAVVALDVPLLFETGSESRFDAVIVVSAPRFVQAARVLRRTDMTAGRLAAILSHQIPDASKQRRADFVVPTGMDRRTSWRSLHRIVRLARRGGCWRGMCPKRRSSHA